jgi:phage tail sheath gpL-like
MSISFNEVPANVRVPGVYIEIDNSLANSAEDLQRVLIVGAKGTGGDTADNKVVLTINPELAAERFGADSQIFEMVTWFYKQDITLPMYSVSVGDNDVALALAATGDDQYHHIVSAFNDETNVRALADFLQARYHALQQIPGIAYIAKKETLSESVEYGLLFNSPFIAPMSINELGDAAGDELSEAELVAAWAGTIAPSLASDPCRPLNTLAINGVYSLADQEWDYSERNLLLYSGMGTYKVNNAKQVFVERPITTYKENASGSADDSYLDVTVPATAMYFRQKQRTRILSKYPRHKLARDGSKFSPGQAVATPAIIKGQLLALYRELELKAIVQDFDGYKASLIVELDADNKSRINIQDSPQFVNGMLIYAGKMQFRK